MTQDFIPSDSYDPGPEYPVVFGITMTPKLSGILLGLAGIAGAAYLWTNFVQPELDKNQQLAQDVTQKREQLDRIDEIKKDIEKAKVELAAAKKKRTEVLSLFGNESTLNTLLLDVNRQIKARNANVPAELARATAGCPAFITNNLREYEEDLNKKRYSFASGSQLNSYTPDAKASGVITDGSYGTAINNKLKRQVTKVHFQGNFEQTQAILRSVERLQPLLVLKNLQFGVANGDVNSVTNGILVDPRGGRLLTGCKPEPIVDTEFQLEALIPLTEEELAAQAKSAAPPAEGEKK